MEIIPKETAGGRRQGSNQGCTSKLAASEATSSPVRSIGIGEETAAVRNVKKSVGRSGETVAQRLLKIHLDELGITTEFEYKFCDRDWRFDLVDHENHTAFEISGGNWSGGHRRGKKQEDEYDKINTAQLLGWRVMQFTNAQVLDGRAKAFLQSNLINEETKP